MTAEPDLPINDAVPAPTKIEPANLFLWNWRQMQVYAQACVAHATAAKDAEIEALRAEADQHLQQAMSNGAKARAAQARADKMAEALRLALDSHGVMLMTDPPQDAWKVRRVEEIGRALLRDQESE